MLKGLKGLLFEDTAPAAKPAQQAAPSIAASLPPVAVTSAGDPRWHWRSCATSYFK